MLWYSEPVPSHPTEPVQPAFQPGPPPPPPAPALPTQEPAGSPPVSPVETSSRAEPAQEKPGPATGDSMHLSVCLTVHVSLCLSVCLSISYSCCFSDCSRIRSLVSWPLPSSHPPGAFIRPTCPWLHPLKSVPFDPAAAGVAPAGGSPAHVPAHHPEPCPDRSHIPGASASCCQSHESS